MYIAPPMLVRSTRLTFAAALVAALAVALAPVAGAAPAAGPGLAKCGKLKRGFGKLNRVQKRRVLRRVRVCLRQNRANRIAFNQIKNGHFVGVRGDGMGVDHTFCANGRYETRTSSRSGTGVSTGRRWRVTNALVRNRGRWINAIVRGQGGLEIAIARRGAQWKVGISSFDRVTDPGDVDRTNARRACATL